MRPSRPSKSDVNTAQAIESQRTSDTVIALAEELQGDAAEALKQTLLAALVRGRPTVVEASQVARVGTAALQVLLAFLRDAECKALAVELRAPSRSMLDALAGTGLALEPLIAAALAANADHRRP